MKRAAVQCIKKEIWNDEKKIEKVNRRDSNHGLCDYQTGVITTRPSMLRYQNRLKTYKKRSLCGNSIAAKAKTEHENKRDKKLMQRLQAQLMSFSVLSIYRG